MEGERVSERETGGGREREGERGRDGGRGGEREREGREGKRERERGREGEFRNVYTCTCKCIHTYTVHTTSRYAHTLCPYYYVLAKGPLEGGREGREGGREGRRERGREGGREGERVVIILRGNKPLQHTTVFYHSKPITANSPKCTNLSIIFVRVKHTLCASVFVVLYV